MSLSTGWALGLGLAAVAASTVCGRVWWATSAARHAEAEARDGAGGKGPKRTEFAEDRDPARPAPAEVKFDPARAMKYLRAICDIGPRVSGSDGMAKQRELIEKHFAGLGATVTRQEFRAKQASRRAATDMVNLAATWNPDAARRIVLCTHYDTRPIADQEPNRGNWNRPFASANDGASGAAMFMELAHHMKGLKTEHGVDFVFFDGEEYVFEPDRTGLGGGDQYFFGSKHFADEYKKSLATSKRRYEAGVLFDLFAGKGAKYPVENNSLIAARAVVDQLWRVAADLKATSFRYEQGPEVQDDHLALNRADIPTVDVIDFSYPHWHRLTDTPDKCSGEQMAEVARVVTAWLQLLK